MKGIIPTLTQGNVELWVTTLNFPCAVTSPLKTRTALTLTGKKWLKYHLWTCSLWLAWSLCCCWPVYSPPPLQELQISPMLQMQLQTQLQLAPPRISSSFLPFQKPKQPPPRRCLHSTTTGCWFTQNRFSYKPVIWQYRVPFAILVWAELFCPIRLP